MRRLALLAVLSLLLPACDSGTDDSGSDGADRIAGRYTGGRTVPRADELAYTVVLVEEPDGRIDGIGTFENDKGSQTYFVSGTRTGDAVTLRFRTGVLNRTDTFTATVGAAGRLDGTITGSFHPGTVPFALVRAPG